MSEEVEEALKFADKCTAPSEVAHSLRIAADEVRRLQAENEESARLADQNGAAVMAAFEREKQLRAENEALKKAPRDYVNLGEFLAMKESRDFLHALQAEYLARAEKAEAERDDFKKAFNLQADRANNSQAQVAALTSERRKAVRKFHDQIKQGRKTAEFAVSVVEGERDAALSKIAALEAVVELVKRGNVIGHSIVFSSKKDLDALVAALPQSKEKACDKKFDAGFGGNLLSCARPHDHKGRCCSVKIMPEDERPAPSKEKEGA